MRGLQRVTCLWTRHCRSTSTDLRRVHRKWLSHGAHQHLRRRVPHARMLASPLNSAPWISQRCKRTCGFCQREVPRRALASVARACWLRWLLWTTSWRAWALGEIENSVLAPPTPTCTPHRNPRYTSSEPHRSGVPKYVFAALCTPAVVPAKSIGKMNSRHDVSGTCAGLTRNEMANENPHDVGLLLTGLWVDGTCAVRGSST